MIRMIAGFVVDVTVVDVTESYCHKLWMTGRDKGHDEIMDYTSIRSTSHCP
jgi:hypothetical protein